MTKFAVAKEGLDTCKWIDDNPNVHIIGMTQDRGWVTIYYVDWHDKVSCDPQFMVPPNDNVRPLQSPSAIPPGAVPQPQTLC